MLPNAVHTEPKRAKSNPELPRGHSGKPNQPAFCYHGLSKGLVWTKKRFEFSMEVIQPKQWKQWKEVFHFSAYNWQKYHNNDSRFKENAFTRENIWDWWNSEIRQPKGSERAELVTASAYLYMEKVLALKCSFRWWRALQWGPKCWKQAVSSWQWSMRFNSDDH